MDSLASFQVITEERGLNLEKVQVDMLGNAKKVSVILPGFVCSWGLHGFCFCCYMDCFCSTETIDTFGAGHYFS